MPNSLFFPLLYDQKCGRQWFSSCFTIPISPSLVVISPLCPPPAAPSYVPCCVVSAHWDMLFGLIYNASPAPGHHVWQMTYFCADPHRALTWGGGWGMRASMHKSVYVCLFVHEAMVFVDVRNWDDEWRLVPCVELMPPVSFLTADE